MRYEILKIPYLRRNHTFDKHSVFFEKLSLSNKHFPINYDFHYTEPDLEKKYSVSFPKGIHRSKTELMKKLCSWVKPTLPKKCAYC